MPGGGGLNCSPWPNSPCPPGGLIWLVSLLLLIDGYNVIPPVAPPGRGADANWLQYERQQLIERLSEHLSRRIRRRTCLVFDAHQPPRDRPSRFHANEIDVWFAVEYPEADDLLEEIIAKHSAPKRLAVVSSDRRVQAAANRRGATPFDSQVWFDRLTDGVVCLAPSVQIPKSGAGQGSEPDAWPDGDKPRVEQDSVDSWMREFGF
jgi:predicted RNA-binding protein with PIN domain